MTLAAEAQRQAAAPRRSSWVSANAGSGKTRVLTDRVARLLLAGTDPARVLCLTYTKAAAAEMQTRLFRTLGEWAMLDDARLRAALVALGEPGHDIPDRELARARTLFARALETPGGLKIQTIHAFCEALLRRFPIEAGVAPQFAVLDDRQARALREEVLDAFALDAPQDFAELAHHFGREDIDALLLEIARHRAAFVRRFDAAALAATLGARPDVTLAGIADEVVDPAARRALAELLPHLRASGPQDGKDAEKIAGALASAEPGEMLAGLEAALLYGKSAKAPFGSKAGKFPTKAVRTRLPALMEVVDDLMDRLAEARPLRLANAAFAKSAALNRFGRAWIAAWSGRKAALGVLDFDDMIDRTEALLARPGTAAWVLWRLDGGIDHILVDEAQDTSPAQWRVIEAISSEFFAGEGARPVERTIFVVGDEKQSIYSFQGAEPGEFAAKAAHYTARLDAIGAELQRCDLLYSFRSAGAILELVDTVFGGPAGEGLSTIRHHAFDTEKPGRVELWPFLPKPEKPEETAWDNPVDQPGPDDPVMVLARRIATTIRGWLDTGRVLPGEGRAIRAGDVMILVQRRNALFDAIIRELKRAAVPVAGADLLRIGGELAVRDLLAALRFAATPRDDLSLAALLRSPLGGLSEDELFEIAHGREGSLDAALRRQPPERWPAVRALLDDLLRTADYLRPFEILSRILVRHGGRQRLAARLGAEAEEGIDALLDQAVAYEAVEAPSLTGFLDWLDRDEVAVKRRMDEGQDQVRVMTVHGAKGLEAPIVLLPDTAPRSESANPPQILPLGDGRVVWRARADEAPPAIAGAEAARCALVRAENRRLLYVALTRAKSWLLVAGAGDPKASGEGWHALVADAMAGLPCAREAGPDGDTLVHARGWTDGPGAPSPARQPAPEPAPAIALPAWAREPARVPAAPPRPVSPSGLGGGHVLPGDAEGALPEAEAKARGTAVHRLLEHLHGRPASERAALAARLLPGAADLDERLAEAAAVLDAPELAAIFAEGLAEVPVAADLPELGGRRILGRLDRLVVGPKRVLAVDFKSNRAVPAAAEAVPEGILRQMGAYRAALRRIFPGRSVETAILWTATARLMPLPDALVDAALARGAPGFP
ncbi:MAG: double-strand break repair helicase AddA [Amaricoccus sp.]|uniref:double-strand break repair helicase AddA n=1 Tax=Amaricoccus sp. TaxID=1872485 RepID=UPI0039E65A96